MHIILTIVVSVLTLLFVIVRPKGLNEAWATVIGAGALLALHLETVRQAVHVVINGADVLVFLFALLVLSNLVRDSGFFEWAAIFAAETAGESGTTLYRNIFLLGAATTALFSLDTTAVIMTPIVIALVRRVGIAAGPFLLTCAFVANSGSLILPVSNLTNLLFYSAFHWHFQEFVWRMLLPQAVVLFLNYHLLKRIYVKDINRKIVISHLPEPREIVPNVPFFWFTVVILILVMVGYSSDTRLHFAPYVLALAGASALLIFGMAIGRSSLRSVYGISWSVFPFVIGLFIVVRGVQNIGLTVAIGQVMAHSGHSSLVLAFASTLAAAIGSNFINNIPMALLSLSALEPSSVPISQYGALIGCDVGPNITIAGSLATILVISTARQHGAKIEPAEFFKAGIKITPILLGAAALALWASFLLF